MSPGTNDGSGLTAQPPRKLETGFTAQAPPAPSAVEASLLRRCWQWPLALLGGMVRRWAWLLVILLAVPLLVWGYDRMLMVDWVGSTDLDVKFAVTDAATGEPIPGARVEVLSEDGFDEERGEQAFVLVADASGVASKECRDNMCSGVSSGLGFTNTFSVRLPCWCYRVAADGFEQGEWSELDVPKFYRRVQRVSPGKTLLVVPVSVYRRSAEPPAAADQPRD